MKETYFLIERDYWHMMRLIGAAWQSGRPNQLKWIVQEIYNKHNLTGVTQNLPDISESVKMLLIS
jgi:hypothetical protein